MFWWWNPSSRSDCSVIHNHNLLLGTLCPVFSHEQDNQHKTLPHCQSVPPWQPRHDPWTLQRVLSVCKSSLNTFITPAACQLTEYWWTQNALWCGNSRCRNEEFVCSAGFWHSRTAWWHDSRCWMSEDCPWNPQWAGPWWLSHQGSPHLHIHISTSFHLHFKPLPGISLTIFSFSRSMTDEFLMGCLLYVVFQITCSVPSVQQWINWTRCADALQCS